MKASKKFVDPPRMITLYQVIWFSPCTEIYLSMNSKLSQMIFNLYLLVFTASPIFCFFLDMLYPMQLIEELSECVIIIGCSIIYFIWTRKTMFASLWLQQMQWVRLYSNYELKVISGYSHHAYPTFRLQLPCTITYTLAFRVMKGLGSRYQSIHLQLVSPMLTLLTMLSLKCSEPSNLYFFIGNK